MAAVKKVRMRKVPKLFHQWRCVNGAVVSSDVSYESARGGATSLHPHSWLLPGHAIII